MPVESPAKTGGRIRKRGQRKSKKDDGRDTQRDTLRAGPRGDSDHGPAAHGGGGSQVTVVDSGGEGTGDMRSAPGGVDEGPGSQRTTREPGSAADRHSSTS